ncbi:hypothetical protein EDB81DRAFT_886264 [Dactylonectria macrodidyma]|uniref:Uncharacterized protein n=1 Tax=Dactylonectria macrodidyma TaxID=307937 RepID=A0A9P9IXZ3_9HYPO|nr:hypothetical protein EDB81DRAFT_886264 [Dactylonectria macrodidyma]
MGKLTPRFFNKPVRFRIPPNSLMIFLNVNLYEVHVDGTSQSPWVRIITLTSYVEMQAAIRPKSEVLQAVAQEAEAHGDEELPIWVEIGLNLDLKQYFEGKLEFNASACPRPMQGC